MANITLHSAKIAKKDEFYTQYADIENELCYYTDQFKNKIIYCNCDNPYESNFFKYFIINFNSLGLKKLIATCYGENPYKTIITEVNNYNLELLFKNKKNVLTRLKGDGDFRSEECTELLKQADIVVTNPPFSLFREYVAQLMKYEKKFLIIGNTNALTYKEIFPLIKENKMRTGYTKFNVGMYFFVPDTYEKYQKILNGRKMVRVSTSCWFTNLEVTKHKKNITLYRKYTPEEYPKYDNYDAIDVSKVAEIPYDYTGAMGVPITFIDKYNPEQFEIVALGNSRDNFTPNKYYTNPIKVKRDGTEVSGGAINCVLAINKKEKPTGRVYYKSDNSNYLIPPYARVIIRRIGDAQ